MKKLIAAAAAALLLLAGCGQPAAPGPGAGPATSPDAPAPASGTLVVFAAASLKGAFEEMTAEFTAEHPGVEVTYSFLGSNALVDQIAAGAPADVFASADEKNYNRALDEKLVQPGTIFATNALTLVTEAGNPTGITGLDASLDGKKLVICAVGVPCGNATEALAKDIGITLAPVSEEQNVKDVLGKVTSGEADAGVVYTTDAKSAGDKVATVALAKADAHVNKYPIGVVAESEQADLAAAFVAHVTGPKGQAVLAAHGFGKP